MTRNVTTPVAGSLAVMTPWLSPYGSWSMVIGPTTAMSAQSPPDTNGSPVFIRMNVQPAAFSRKPWLSLRPMPWVSR